MCGICGLFDLQGRKVDRETLEAMNRQLEPRGPDEEGIYCQGNLGLASRRLSIIDLKSGSQPMHNEDRHLWVVFNGEIYNYREIKKQLLQKGHFFYTQSDTECLLHLYEEEGEAMLDKLDGMFALAIWDEEKKELFLARDPLGKKPLYWAKTGSVFVFGSEPKAILALPGFRRTIAEGALAKYFFYGYVPARQTIFAGINRVAAGHYLTINSRGKVKETPYWQLDYSRKDFRLSFAEAVDRTDLLLRSAVTKRLIADVPVGVFLSGGIDSSLVAAMIPRGKLEAFTIGFEQINEDESAWAKKVADILGLKNNLKIFSDNEVAFLLPEILAKMDEPMADVSILPTYLLSSFTRQKVKVALSGDGGDEDFAGYPKYPAHLVAHKFFLEKLPLGFMGSFFSGRLGAFFRYVQSPLYLRNQFWISSLAIKEVEKLTGGRLDLTELETYHQDFNGIDPLDEALFLDQKLTLTDEFLLKVDRASMTNSLEVRCPFLDKNLVEFAATVPYELKIKGFQTKAILRCLSTKFFPPEITNRPKQGFGIPLRKWLEVDLQPLVREYTSISRIKKEGLLNASYVKELLAKKDIFFLWKLLVFEIWQENWLHF